MKLLEFQMERYGAIFERTITIEPASGLVVVYGPNEIGKSTLLSGVSDFCFGVPNNSPHGGIYGYEAMRLRAMFVLADGTEMNLRRRKGRGKTLSDDAGRAYDQDVLGRALGVTTRERFSNLFGLNHESLREGADRLLSADGELGRLIIEAGGGLRGMVDRIAELDPAIDGLFDLRRAGHRQFYKVLDNIESADKVAKAELVSRDVYSEARGKCETAQRQYEALLGEARDLAKRTSQVERIVRVQPLLLELQQLAVKFSSYDDLGPLESGFHRRIAASLETVEARRREVDRAKEEYERLIKRREGLTINAAWPQYEERIAALSDRGVEVRKARQSLLNRRRELSDAERSLQSLRALLNLAPDASLEKIAPTPSQLDAAQSLLKEAIERRAALAVQTQSAADLTEETAGLREATQKARTAGRDRPFGVSDGDLSSLPEAEAGAAAQGKRLAKEAIDLEANVRRLGFRDLEHLRGTTLPDHETLQVEVDLRARLRSDREAAVARHSDAQAAVKAADRKIATLQSDGLVASPDAVDRARGERRRALEPLVHSHLTGQLPGSLEQREDNVRTLEQTIVHADGLSDRRVADSDRVAALEQLRSRREEALSTGREAQAKVDEIDARLALAAKIFAENYPAVTALEADPNKLRAIASDAVRLLDAAEHLQQRLADVEVRAKELEPRIQALAIVEERCSLPIDPHLSLAQRVQAAVAAVRAHDLAYEDYVRDERSIVAREAQLSRVEETLAGLRQQEEDWVSQWSNALSKLQLEATTSLDRTEKVVREWATARGELSNVSQTRRRIEQMEADESALSRMTIDLSQILGVAIPADAVEAAALLKKAWEAHQKRWVESVGIEPEIQRAEEQEIESQAALTMAEAALKALSEEIPGQRDLVVAARRIEERDQTTDRMRQLMDQIQAAGDGFSVDELSQQCGDRDIDTLRAEHGAIDLERQRLDELTRAAIEEMQSLDAQLKAYDDPSKVNQAVADRECAASEMHAIVEQWTEMTLARDLLKEAISRVRAEHQDPLITRAGELFRLTTKNAFVGVAAEVDHEGEPVVVGRRDDGTRVAIRDMSDGVRDQLFLAFRLASIERYAQAAEPIPFIADDILVNFDDERSAATLGLLAEFGKTNQVLLFTHHRSVRDAAVNLPRDAHVQIVDLADVSTALDSAMQAA